MKSEELMVGDWVQVKDCIDQSYYFDEYEPGEIVQVREILDNGINPNWAGAEVSSILGLEDIQPIPLTPEILEKNGFHFTKADRMSLTDRYVLGVKGTRDGAIVEITFYNPDAHGVKVLTEIHTQSSHESGINSVHSCDIESVHELQRALRLCKIDKTIEL